MSLKEWINVKKKNLIIYIFFVMVVMLVPSKVMAAQEYTLNRPCHENEANDFWHFKECKVEPYAVNDESKNFQFTLDNSHVYTKDVSVSYKDNQKFVCSKRKPNDENLILTANVCDIYYIKNTHKATCVYKSDDNDIFRIKISTASKDMFDVEYYAPVSEGKYEYKNAGTSKINFENFNYDGTCPTVVKAEAGYSMAFDGYTVKLGKGESWINVEKDSTNKVDHPTCTEEEKEKFKKEEAQLYEKYLTVYNEYKGKVENREFSKYSTTPSSILAELKTFASVPALNFERVYKKGLDKLKEKYSCEGLPSIIKDLKRDEEITKLQKELNDLVEATIQELSKEAESSGDTAAQEVYDNFSNNEASTFFGDIEADMAHVFEGIALNWDFGRTISDNCQELLGDGIIEIIELLFTWVKIMAPILLIIFGSLDYAKAVLANDNDALKKATSNFVKRAIAAAIIFFLPMLIELVFNLDGLSETRVGNPLCGISKVVIKW